MEAEKRESVINKAELAEEEKKKLTDLNQENETLKVRLAEQEKKQVDPKGNIIIIPFKG